MKKRILSCIALLTLTLLISTGCQTKKVEETSGDKTNIKIGGTSISQVYYEAAKDKFEAMGYKTEFVPFDSNPVVLEACNNGDVDISLGQHLKFVQSFNKNKEGNLDMAKPYSFYTGIGLYSNKHKAVEDFPQNAKIAIMNDAMNMDIALKILEENGLIKLKEGLDTYTIADIVENPKDIQVIDMDQAQTVTALDDMDAACIFFTHMANADKDPSSYISRDTQMINYPMGVIVKKKKVESKWATDFANCFRDEEVQNSIEKKFPNVFEFYESDDQVKQ